MGWQYTDKRYKASAMRVRSRNEKFKKAKFMSDYERENKVQEHLRNKGVTSCPASTAISSSNLTYTNVGVKNRSR